MKRRVALTTGIVVVLAAMLIILALLIFNWQIFFPMRAQNPFSENSDSSDSQSPQDAMSSSSGNSDSSFIDTVSSLFGGLGGGGNSGGSGGSSSESSSGGTESPGCSLRQISYSLTDFNIVQSCSLQDSSGFCISKEANCSVAISNIDSSGGIFDIEFRLIEQGGNIEDYIGLKIESGNVDAGSSAIIETLFSVQSQGQEGDANKELSCFPTTKTVPKKEVCIG